MTTETGEQGTGGEARLEALLAEARRAEPGADLVARVLADARAVQLAPAAPRRPRRRLPGLVAALGGWGWLGGVTAAGLVGLSVGYWAPDAVDGVVPELPLSLSPDGGIWTPNPWALALEADDV
jgi:hypothetical protein